MRTNPQPLALRPLAVIVAVVLFAGGFAPLLNMAAIVMG
jgi:hypothetical protein